MLLTSTPAAAFFVGATLIALAAAQLLSAPLFPDSAQIGENSITGLPSNLRALEAEPW